MLALPDPRLQKDRLPDLQILHGGAHRLPQKRGHLVAIPVLPVVAATHGGKGDPEGADCRRAFGLWRERYHVLALVFRLTLPVDLLGSTTDVAFDLFLFLTR